MLSIFTVPKPFQGNINTIQRNAIQSWLELQPKCEVILFGDDEGVAEAAAEFEVLHIPEVKKNEFGVPLVNDIFKTAQKIAKNRILAYVNADIILMSDFMKAVRQITLSKFLMVGRRWDIDIKELIKFEEADWEEKLRERVVKGGKLHGPAGIDYFVFSNNIWESVPPFAIGRTAWDNWLLYKAWISGISIIDATEVVMIAHQNHFYSHPEGKVGIWRGKEAKINLRLAGGEGHMLTIRDSCLILTTPGLKKPRLTIYRILSFPFRYFKKAPFFARIFFCPGWLGMILWRRLNKTWKD